jgi:anti-anti-sigma regulatory factor
MRFSAPRVHRAMFTSQSLRAVAKPGTVAFREHRLDDVVHQIDVSGPVTDGGAPELGRRIEAALSGGVRWLILDLAEASEVSDGVLVSLVHAAAALRSRKGELIVAGAIPPVAQRLAAYDVAHRPAVAANVDQAVMILKMLRPKTDIRRPPQRAKQRISSLTLPRIEPPAPA